MKNLKRSIVASMFVAGVVFSGGSLAAYAQHGCGGHGGGASHTDHGTSDAPQDEESARPTIVDGVQVVKIAVTGAGYTPSRIVVKEDMPVRLVFEQFSSSACASQVQIPSLNVPKVKLPKGKETPVEFTPTNAGTYQYTCGMEMLAGTLVVESSN